MNTNYKILAMRLGCVRNRVSTLVHRLEYVLDEDIAGCHMVIDTIDDIISKLEACE